MKNIKIYNTNTEYQSEVINLPDIHVVYSKDNNSLHFGGIKKVIDYISEEEYGTAVFDIFRAQGWIASDAHVMTMYEAKLITSISNYFEANTGITDATFIKYFNLIEFPIKSGFSYYGFKNCTALTKAYVPKISYNQSPFTGCTALSEVEVAEGVTYFPTQLLPSSCTVKINFPSTLTEIKNSNNYNLDLEVLDLTNTVITTLGDSFLATIQTKLKKIYLPTTLTSVVQYSFRRMGVAELIVFNSDTSLDIGANCYASNVDGHQGASTVVFKNDIPITIGGSFGAKATGVSTIIFNSSTAPTIGTNFFNDSKNNTKIYVPDDYILTYSAISNLSAFANAGHIYGLSQLETDNPEYYDLYVLDKWKTS